MAELPKHTDNRPPADAATKSSLQSSEAVLREAYKVLAETRHIVQRGDRKQREGA